MAWVNFNTIQDDLVALIAANVPAAELVKKEADERDYVFSNMPLIDVRLTEGNPEIRAGRDYYVFTTFEVQVTTHDLSGFDEAATLRDTVLSDTIDVIRNTANFSANLESSRIGQVQFSNAKDENSGAFMAAATVEIQTETFVDQ